MRKVDFVLILAIALLASLPVANTITIEKIKVSHQEEVAALKEEIHKTKVSSAKGFIFNTAYLTRIMGDDFVESYLHNAGVKDVLNSIPKDIQEEAKEELVEVYSKISSDFSL